MKNYWLAALALVVLLAGGCGGGGGSDTSGSKSPEASQAANTEPGPDLDQRDANKIASMWVAMDGWDGAETVSFLTAENNGYFRKLKIAPLTLSPVTAKLAIPDVVRGQDVLGVVTAPEAIRARDEGDPIVVVGAVLKRATAALIWTQESGIEKIGDLKGKTIATQGLPSQKSLLEHVLTEAGVDPAEVEVIGVGNNMIPALVKGKADAIFGGSANVEGIDLESRGLQPVVTPITALGVPDYDELVLVALQNVAEANPRLVEDFVSALAQGASSAKANRQEAVKVLEASGEKNPETSSAAMHRQIAATAGMLSSSGDVDPDRFQRLIDWMFENEMIGKDYSAEELLPYS
ncbi:MAG TPA: ABC transporter substrate-binding protein [Solirubrobacterales bacterium]|jgi:putative hydroxymethylpyrimidine transport system substrate-binding protein|nr:ABC transporter substrate-binding protein [Solirubrobacterales bacterium]